ncbi:MAG: SigE family RNA polymerase sigma factor [Jatrophihabitans sp.]|uniref:SigE family RNA polymerase sigma factor n=1 Tax=Jatrophihabitans sp. TaxID=1932789 RepID=UPI003F7F2FCB
MTADGTRPRPATVADLARTHGLELLRFGYLVTGDRHRAEDLVQDVLLALHRRFPATLGVDDPVAYARRAVVNGHISRGRRRASGELSMAELPESATAPRDDPAERDLLWRALRRLPDRQRAVLVLRFYEDATDEQIAELLGCRRGTVRSLASRALAALREDTDVTEETGR